MLPRAMTGEAPVDVCVVGAGAAGIACAHGLACRGLSVLLLDRLHPMPACLKAEKIGGHGAVALVRLGFQSAVEAGLTPLHSVAVFFGERALRTQRLDPPEAGLLYHTFVNSLRARLDPRVEFRPGAKAVGLDPGPDSVTVVTDGGARIDCRLAVLATGDARHLLGHLGATYVPEPPHQALVVAWTMEGPLGDPAPVDSQTYHRPMAGGPVSYVTFFRLGTVLRANLFCAGPVAENWQQDLKRRPLAALAAQNRRLAAAARSWRIVSPVITRKVPLARLAPPSLDRVVVLGDAAHTVDPASGGGLDLALLEVELLLDFYVPRWLRDGDACAAAIGAFYADPRRRHAERHFFAAGRYLFALNHDASPRGRWRRLRFVAGHLPLVRPPSQRVLPPGRPWQRPAPHLYEQYAPAE